MLLARQPPTLRDGLIGVGGVLAFIGIGALYLWVVDRWRGRVLARFCLERGFRFERDRPGEAKKHAGGCPLFDEGNARWWGYTISGTRGGVPFTAFEYEWWTGRAAVGGRTSSAQWCGRSSAASPDSC